MGGAVKPANMFLLYSLAVIVTTAALVGWLFYLSGSWHSLWGMALLLAGMGSYRGSDWP